MNTQTELQALKEMIGFQDGVDYGVLENRQKLRYNGLAYLDEDADGPHILSLLNTVICTQGQQNFQRVSGFAYPQSNYPLETPVEIQENQMYGLVYLDLKAKKPAWVYFAGSFVHIYGVYKGVQGVFDSREDDQDSEDEQSEQDDGVRLLFVFYELKRKLSDRIGDVNFAPVRVILRASLSPTLNAQMGDSFYSEGPLGSIREGLTTNWEYFKNLTLPVIDFANTY